MNIYPFIQETFRRASFERVAALADGSALSALPAVDERQLRIPPDLLRDAAREAFGRLAFFFRPSHIALLKARLASEDASANDRRVLSELLENARVASQEVLPLCQDTGAACVYGWKEEGVVTGGDDEAALEEGAALAYAENHLRASMVSPAGSFFAEANTGNNLPAQCRLEAVPGPRSGGEAVYRFLFTAKGGGSSNKSAYFAATPSLLQSDRFDAFLKEHIAALGTAACPPYRLAVVVGGPSPEANLELLKLATCEALDSVPYFGAPGAESSLIHRDRFWEERAMEIGRETGLGAQFGGTSLLLDARVLRLGRHAATCPVSLGVSCAAHRCLLGCISRDGLFLETQDHAPNGASESARGAAPDSAVRIDLSLPLTEVRGRLTALPPGSPVCLTGNLLVARDAAHLRWHTLLAQGQALPAYLFRHPVFYAGPSETPPGRILGSIGPTTAARMDPYADELLSRGASLVTIAKGNRGPLWKTAAARHNGVYLGVTGGAAALLTDRHVTACAVIDYSDLGMEAVRLLTVQDLPAVKL